MKRFISMLVAASLAFSSIPAFAWGNGDDNSSSIEKTDARKMNKVLKGVVIQVSDAKIDSSNKAEGSGAAGGALVGGAIGSNTQNSIAGALIGAVIGTATGAIAGAFVGGQDAQDLVIQLESGDLINVTQALDDKIGKFAEDDPVLVVYKGDSGRVIRNKMAQAAKNVPAPIASSDTAVSAEVAANAVASTDTTISPDATGNAVATP